MKFGNLILALSLVAVGNSAHGQFDEDSMGMGGVSKDLMQKISKAQGSLRNLAETKDCKFPKIPDCSAKSLCEGLTENANSLYLYKNAEGKGIPNVFLFQVDDALEGCFETKLTDITKDPFLNPKGFLKNSKLWQEEQNKNIQLVENTKVEIVKVLESRKDGKNDKDIDGMIRRIQTVKMKKIAGNEEEYLVKGDCSLPNAVFDYPNHELLICPQLYRYPEAALETVIAHELGHAIDPCVVGGEFKQTSDGGFSTKHSWNNKDPGKVLIPGIPYDSNPFKNVMSCLSKKESLGVRAAPDYRDLDDELMILEQEYETVLNEGYEDPTAKIKLDETQKKREALKTGYPFEKQCLKWINNGDAQESFADWVAAQVKRTKVSQIKDPAKAKTYALESEGIFLSYSCGEVKQRIVSKVLSQFDARDSRKIAAQCDDMMKTIGKDTHPQGEQRIDKLHLAVPEIQKALDCKPDKTVPDCR